MLKLFTGLNYLIHQIRFMVPVMFIIEHLTIAVNYRKAMDGTFLFYDLCHLQTRPLCLLVSVGFTRPLCLLVSVGFSVCVIKACRYQRVVRNRKSENDRQYNEQQKKDKWLRQ
jgi:hypothetical protein